jgi:uncharacterized membrane protein (DUF4010 family)
MIGIAIAALGGAAIGVERQWSGHASGSNARFGGVRTFTLVGGVAGLAGWLTAERHAGAALVLVAGAVAIVVAGYLAASRRDVDATTETAGLVVIGAGFAAGLGWITVASGVVAVTTLLLVEKTALHSFVRRMNTEELRAASLFAVMAVVVLPLLPAGPIATLGGLKPRELWLLVLLFSGLSFCGYITRRIFGAERGYPVAGLLAGLVSSTNATLTFARHSRAEPGLARPLAVGAIAACTMLFPRIFVALLVLNSAVAVALLPYIALPAAVGAATLAWRWRTTTVESEPAATTNPLQLVPALQMAATFQAVLFAVEWAHRQFGAGGLMASGAVLGLTDVDALTISMARSGGIAPQIAAQAIAIGVLVNCVLKSVLAVTLGTRPFAKAVGTTVGAMAAGIGISLAIALAVAGG